MTADCYEDRSMTFSTTGHSHAGMYGLCFGDHSSVPSNAEMVTNIPAGYSPDDNVKASKPIGWRKAFARPSGVIYPCDERELADRLDVTMYPDPAPRPFLELTFEDVFDGLSDECLTLLIAKQRSYGPKNVESLGFFGVFDRLASDKVERLRNAMQGTVKNGHVEITFAETLADESVEDTLKDMVNYALILIALKRGLWGRPLRDAK